MIVCICNAITERDIDDAVDNGVTTLEALRATLQISNQCGTCCGCAQACLEAAVDRRLRSPDIRSAPVACGSPEPLAVTR